jgi:hypothetical protein
MRISRDIRNPHLRLTNSFDGTFQLTIGTLTA